MSGDKVLFQLYSLESQKKNGQELIKGLQICDIVFLKKRAIGK